MIEPLGVPLATWAGLFALGGVAGLALGVTAQPQWSALPRFAIRARLLRNEGEHFLYGGLCALLGVLVVSLFGSLVHPLLVGLAYFALLLAGAWWGSEPASRRAALVAHAKLLGVLSALSVGAFVLTEFVVLA